MLAGLQKKDEQALAACIRQYGAYAASVVRAAGPGLSAQDVEEAAAEAFVKLWQAAERLDLAKGALKSYLAAVCRNEARSRLRTLRPDGAAGGGRLCPGRTAGPQPGAPGAGTTDPRGRRQPGRTNPRDFSAVLLPPGENRKNRPRYGAEPIHRKNKAVPRQRKSCAASCRKGGVTHEDVV